MIEKKQCQMCKVTKLVAEFHKSKTTKSGYSSYCKTCKYEANKTSNRKRMSEDRIKFLEQRKNWHLKITYGIGLDEYKTMLEKQNGACAICLREEKGRMLAVDHSHATNEIRGLLCGKCNRAIGQFDDNVESLKRAALYIEAST